MLLFEEATHTYRFDGAVVPSVTQILAPLNDLSFVDPQVLEYKRQLGTAVHKATELYDLGDLDEDSLAPVIRPYLDAWIRFRREKPFEILGMEQKVYHPLHRYAGTYDRMISMDGRRGPLDIKTGETLPGYGPQTAAYKAASEAETGERLTGRWTIQLRDDGTYRLHTKADADDWPVFLSCLNLYRFRNKHAA